MSYCNEHTVNIYSHKRNIIKLKKNKLHKKQSRFFKLMLRLDTQMTLKSNFLIKNILMKWDRI